MEPIAEKSALAAERAEKKAARRAAFIQDVAVAVYELGVQRQNEIEAKRQALEFAASEQHRLRELLSEAELKAASPLEALYCLNNDVERGYRWANAKISLEEYRAKEALAWLLKKKILPEGTTQLPDTEAQFLIYATWRQTNPKLSTD